MSHAPALLSDPTFFSLCACTRLRWWSCCTSIKVWAPLFLIKLLHVWDEAGIIPIILSAGKIWAGAIRHQHLRITKHFKHLSILPINCFVPLYVTYTRPQAICMNVVSSTFIYHSLVRIHWEVVMMMPKDWRRHWLLCAASLVFLHQCPFGMWHAKK